MISFNLEKTDGSSQARAATISTDHGVIKTPIFMPVGTAATVKTIHFNELEEEIKAQIILSNTYHLFLRPGEELIHEAGGLHKFMNWTKPILTDSGGYQVYSLSAMRKLTEEGVKFASHIDGSKRFLSPEVATEVQRKLGADFIMAFDECTPYPCDYTYAKKSMELTHRWLDRSLTAMDHTEPLYGYDQLMIPIVQGSVYEDLRAESAQYVSSKGTEINAIGGLSVGEPAPEMYAMTELVCNHLPRDKGRYLMGVGKPENILECIERGIDLFDCVLPSRNARHGLLYTTEGVLHIKNQKWKNDFSPIDPNLGLTTSTQHTKAYLRHLFTSKEYLAYQLATLQNLRFYLWLVEEARRQIIEDNFVTWKNEILPVITRKL